MSEGEVKGEGEVKCEGKGVGVDVDSEPAPSRFPSRTKEPDSAKVKTNTKNNPFFSPSDNLTSPDCDLTETKNPAGKEKRSTDDADDDGDGYTDDKPQPTVGDIPTESPLEQTLILLSDGIFQNGALRKHAEHRKHFEAACQRAIYEHRDDLLTDRTVLAGVLDRVLNLLEDAGVKYPAGLLVAKKQLEKGGPIVRKPPSKRGFEKNIFGGGSILSLARWRNRLEPYKEELQEFLNQLRIGAPTNLREAEEFLARAENDIEWEEGNFPGEFEDIRDDMLQELRVAENPVLGVGR